MAWEFLPGSEFDHVADEWQDLATARYQSHPFLDARFVRQILAHFGSDEIMIAMQRDRGQLSCVAIIEGHGSGVWEVFCPSQLRMTLVLTRADNLLPESLSGLLAALPGFNWLLGLRHYDSMYLGNMSVAPNLDGLEYATTMSVDATGLFDEYWANRSKNLRRSINRYYRKLDKNDIEFRLEVVAGAEQVRDAVRIYGDIESAGWKGRSGSAVHINNEQGRFYVDLLREFAQTDGAQIFNLWFGDRIVSSRLAIAAGGIQIVLKTTYDEQLSQYSPGRLLLHQVLKSAFEDDSIRVVEFYTSATRDQLQWATHERTIHHWNFYRSVVFRRLAAGLRVTKRLLGRTSGSSEPDSSSATERWTT